MGSGDSLEEERRHFLPLPRCRPRSVDDLHRDLVHELDRADRHTGTNHLRCRRGRSANAGKSDDGDARLLRHHGKFQCDLRHYAEGSF